LLKTPSQSLSPLLASAFAAAVLTCPALGQNADAEVGWNSTAALDLIQRGIERRSSEVVDTALQTYTAQGRGFVYFILDAPELDRQSLVRTDQVAVEVYWRSPNEVRQRIVGLREQRELPVTRLHYYLDRLTVVQDNYGQAIVIADGDNVSDVPHPVGFGAEGFYDFRLGDSLTLRLPGVPDPVRVREVQVRPRDPALPAIVGSVFLEATTGALVRMTFTFTPSAYVDPRLDFVHVTLENGLWRGRFWLPHEQRLEIRREMPELDLPFGTVIRTRMRIGDYEFNQPVPESLFASRLPISMVSREERESFAFDRPIDAEWRLEGFGRRLEVEQIRREARSVVRDRAISGLPRNRFSIPTASDLFRYNRAEGLVLGAGWSARPMPTLDTRVHAGWSFGPDRPLGRIELSSGDRVRAGLRGYLSRRADVGGFAPASGVLNTLDALLFAGDYSDPYYVSGGSARLDIPLGEGWSARAGTRAERQESARLTSSFSFLGEPEDFRPVRAVDDGTHLSLGLTVRRDDRTSAGGSWSEARMTAGRLSTRSQSFAFLRSELAGSFAMNRSERRAALELEGYAGWSFGDLPRQELWLIGGRGSLPGYDHRVFGGDRIALANARVSADLTHPWLRGSIFGGAGAASRGPGAERSADIWGVSGSGGIKPSIGIGLGVFYDLVQFDLARGLGSEGRTQLIIEFHRAFWDLL
jgi:hypothetical protein